MDNVSKLEILDSLSQSEYIAASKIAEKLGISEKTLRGRMKELNQELVCYGAQIAMKHGQGYRFYISDEEQYEIWKKKLLQKSQEHMPTTVRERIQYILLLLLNSKGYIKREMIGDFLYVSVKTVSGDLKQIEQILNRYNLVLEKRPGYGMKVTGTEFGKRQCIMNHYLLHSGEWKILDVVLNEGTSNIADCILGIIRKEKLSFTEISLKCLVEYIYVSVSRIRHGYVILEKSPIKRNEKNFLVAKHLIEELMKNGIELSLEEAEIGYLAIYLSGNKMVQIEYNGTTNIVIQQSVDELTNKILESIYQNYQVDMRDNLNLRMCMNKHLLSLDIRMKYCIESRNPLLKEVKENYFFSFLLAQQAGSILADYYEKKISEDESSFLAMIFEVERLKTKNTIIKKNILLVCATGKVSARFLLFSIREKFRDYINNIELCSVYDLEKQECSKFDYIFSTVPIDISVKIPIIIIHDFMTQNEIASVQDKISEQNRDMINKIFKEELFFNNLSGATKEDVIRNMCRRIQKQRKLPDLFCESVLYREQMGSTDFGNLIAIPHSYQKQVEEDIVCVGILESPISWERNQVQLVILSSMGNSKTKQVQIFYEMIEKLMGNKEMVSYILREQTFDSLCRVFAEILSGLQK